ncbi:MAG TPA: FHA domain-containing protein [Candidatus Sulfotelmatobacter sp.]|nr:FHA domain-containing protein [Candidatus Sulfotelmatobacter sp.]
MQAACSNCGTQHVLKDADVGAHPKVKFRCSRCSETTVVDTHRHPGATVAVSPLPSFARGNGSGTQSSLILQDLTAHLPQTKNVVLTIVSGPGAGAAHTLKKPRVVVGRDGADIALEDPEISRHHCVVEVREDYVNLRDLDSTNGTFFEKERVRAAMLGQGAEFRIGETTLRLTFEPK